MIGDVDLVSDSVLERSSVVANCTMNRERGLTGSNGYSRELGLDVLGILQQRLRGTVETVRWLDLCCGSGRALIEAADQLAHAGFADRTEIIGVDLVNYFTPGAPPTPIRLITASVTTWTPPRDMTFDLITCVHGLHYIGDKLAVLTQTASWLTANGVFAASFDAASIKGADGQPLGRPLTAALRDAGFRYDRRTRRVTRDGHHGGTEFPFSYLGADDAAGPNYTGQPAVDSYYSRRAVGASDV